MLKRRKKTLVGLDIGSSAVKVVELGRHGGQHTVVAAGCEPLPYEAIVDNAITDRETVAGAIQRAFRELRVKNREVAVAMSGSAVIVKKISLPAMPDAELAGTIQWEARQHIPYETHTVNLDFHVLGPSTDPGEVDVLLAAAKKDRVDDLTRVVSEAGCVPRVLDVDAFALQNAYEVTRDARTERVDVLVNLGASVVNLNVVQGNRSVFTRDVAIGGNAYSQAIQQELGIDFDRADRLKRGVPVPGSAFEDAAPVIQTVTQNLLQEVSKTVDFFRTTSGTDHVDGIVLAGGTSRIDGLETAFRERFDTEVSQFDPFEGAAIDARALSADQRLELGPVAAIAVGLALRQVDDS